MVSALLALVATGGAVATSGSHAKSATLTDQERGRDVPVHVYLPAQTHACVAKASCPVAFISPGYGVPHTSYSFLADALTAQGYLVVAVQHDLPTDPPLTGKGDLVAIRTPAWQRGAANLRYVKAQLSRAHPDYGWDKLTLIGHSNGGDISALLLRETPDFARKLITLDHRRVPLPLDPALRTLSIRGSDFEADPGVLPAKPASGVCIVEIAGSRHNDMLDDGPAELRSQIAALVLGFLNTEACSA